MESFLSEVGRQAALQQLFAQPFNDPNFTKWGRPVNQNWLLHFFATQPDDGAVTLDFEGAMVLATPLMTGLGPLYESAPGVRGPSPADFISYDAAKERIVFTPTNETPVLAHFPGHGHYIVEGWSRGLKEEGTCTYFEVYLKKYGIQHLLAFSPVPGDTPGENEHLNFLVKGERMINSLYCGGAVEPSLFEYVAMKLDQRRAYIFWTRIGNAVVWVLSLVFLTISILFVSKRGRALMKHVCLYTRVRMARVLSMCVRRTHSPIGKHDHLSDI